jgi:hypothetical protein
VKKTIPLSLCLLATVLTAPLLFGVTDKKTEREKRSVLWDSWYTVTLSGKVPYGFYQDKVEKEGDRLFFQNHFTKNEEGFLNEESLGGASKDDPFLTPLFFHFHSNYRMVETEISGTVDGGFLTVKVKKGEKEFSPLKKSIASKTVLSTFFPLLIAKRWDEMKSGSSISFTALAEDGIDQSFPTLSGYLRLEKEDEIAKKTGTRKIAVFYRDIKSIWYCDSKGMPVRIEMPPQETVIVRVTRAEAEAFLKKPTKATTKKRGT